MPPSKWRSSSSRRIGLTAVGALIAFSLAVVLVSAALPGLYVPPAGASGRFPGWMAGPLRVLTPRLKLALGAQEWLGTGLIAAMCACYFTIWRLSERLSRRAIWTAVIGTQAVFLLSPPLSYTDVFNYVDYARMGLLHGLNPYATIPALGPHGDPAFTFSNWHHLLSPYGELFTLITYAIAPLGVAGAFWALKLILALANLGTLILVGRCADLLGRPVKRAIVIAGLNPLVLVWGLGSDHYDFLMALLIVLAVYLTLQKPRAGEARAGASLVLAAAVKLPAVLLLPAFLAANRPRARTLLGIGCAAIAMAAVSYLAFGLHGPNVMQQAKLTADVGFANLLGMAIGLGGETHALHIALDVVLVAVTAVCTVWAWRTRQWLAPSTLILITLLLTLGWPQPWYLLWILPFVAISPGRALQGLVVMLTVYFLLFYGPTESPVLNALGLHPDTTRVGAHNMAYFRSLLQ